METAKTNGFSIDAVASNNHSNNPRYPLPVQYIQSNFNNKTVDRYPDLMAPRTDRPSSDGFGMLAESPTSRKAAFTLPPLPPFPMKPTTEKPLDHVLTPAVYASQEKSSLEFAERRLQQIASRCDIAKNRAMRIFSTISCYSSKSSVGACASSEENLSDMTESSSDEETSQGSCQHSDAWHQTRAVLKCHWSLLQTEMVRAIDSLNNLKHLRRRCRNWRKAIPLLSEDGVTEKQLEMLSRTRPVERSEKSRHSYYDLASLSQLDFTFPGGAQPSHLVHPHCQEAFAMGCIYCCPAFNRNGSEVAVSSAVPSITARSITVDRPDHNFHLFGSMKPSGNDSSLTCVHYQSGVDGIPSRLSGVSSTSSKDGHDPRRHPTLRPACRSPSYSRASGMNSRHKFHFDFLPSNNGKGRIYGLQQSKNMKEIPIPLWRKVPYPTSFDSVKRSGATASPPGAPCSDFPPLSSTLRNYKVSVKTTLSNVNLLD
uniref:PEHE domain-containing protein n=1 Tax=Mesocestoides corti TaxID=53468 RepID=A0A5K3FTV1_MESCO